jgi:hypothetical protein
MTDAGAAGLFLFLFSAFIACSHNSVFCDQRELTNILHHFSAYSCNILIRQQISMKRSAGGVNMFEPLGIVVNINEH